MNERLDFKGTWITRDGSQIEIIREIDNGNYWLGAFRGLQLLYDLEGNCLSNLSLTLVERIREAKLSA